MIESSRTLRSSLQHCFASAANAAVLKQNVILRAPCAPWMMTPSIRPSPEGPAPKNAVVTASEIELSVGVVQRLDDRSWI